MRPGEGAGDAPSCLCRFLLALSKNFWNDIELEDDASARAADTDGLFAPGRREIVVAADAFIHTDWGDGEKTIR